MEKIDWKEIEEKLRNSIYVHVEFEVEGKKVTVEKTRVKDTRLAYRVFINGEIKGAWLFDSEIEPLVKKVWRKKERGKFEQKRIKRFENFYKKRHKGKGRLVWKEEMLKSIPDLYYKEVTFYPEFASLKTLISTLKKVEGFKLVKDIK